MKREINNESGFTLIEVLVAVFLLAVGMMSAASMQTTAISGNKFSKDTSLAIELAEEMIDRIRINSGREPHKYHGMDTTGTGNCSSYSDPVKGDCEQWRARMMHSSMGLRHAIGKVTVDPSGSDPDYSIAGVPIPYTATVEVTVEWGSKWMARTRTIKFTTIKGTGLWGQN